MTPPLTEPAIKPTRDRANRWARIWQQLGLYTRILAKTVGRIPPGQLLRAQFPLLLRDAATPPIVSVEFTNFCNLSCPYCPSSKKLRPQGMMQEDTFERLLAQLATARVPRVFIVGNGEPTLHPSFHFWILRLKQVVPFLSVTTNLQHLDAGIAETLVTNPGVDLINVSVDGGDKATYEASRVGGKFETLLANLQTLMRLKRTTRHGPILAVRLMLRPSQIDQRKALTHFWRAFGDVVSVQFIYDFRHDQADAYEPDRATRIPCSMPFKALDVHWDGNVPLCSYSDIQTGNPQGLRLGNMRDSTLVELWNSPLMCQYRRGHRQRDPALMPICQNCPGRT